MTTESVQETLFPLSSEPQEASTDISKVEHDKQAPLIAELLRDRNCRKATRVVTSKAYSDLGGGISTALEEPDVWYGKYIDVFSREDENIYPELRTLFEQFNLTKLSVEAFKAMSTRDRAKVALHMSHVLTRMSNLVHTLSVEGNHENPVFAEYGTTQADQKKCANLYGDFCYYFRRTPLGREIATHPRPVIKATDDIRRHDGKKPHVVASKENGALKVAYL